MKVINKGFENSILIPVKSRKTKGTFVKNGEKYMYNNDAADSLGIALFGFYGKEENLQLSFLLKCHTKQV